MRPPLRRVVLSDPVRGDDLLECGHHLGVRFRATHAYLSTLGLARRRCDACGSGLRGVPLLTPSQLAAVKRVLDSPDTPARTPRPAPASSQLELAP